MARNLSATETVDLVCDDFFDGESQREGVQAIYNYRGGTTVEARELDLLSKAVISLLVEETTSFQLKSYQSTVGSEDTSSYVKEEMEVDIPGKTNSYLLCIFGKKGRNSLPGNVMVSFIMPNSFPGEYGTNLVTGINFLLQTPSNE